MATLNSRTVSGHDHHLITETALVIGVRIVGRETEDASPQRQHHGVEMIPQKPFGQSVRPLKISMPTHDLNGTNKLKRDLTSTMPRASTETYGKSPMRRSCRLAGVKRDRLTRGTEETWQRPPRRYPRAKRRDVGVEIGNRTPRSRDIRAAASLASANSPKVRCVEVQLNDIAIVGIRNEVLAAMDPIQWEIRPSMQ